MFSHILSAANVLMSAQSRLEVSLSCAEMIQEHTYVTQLHLDDNITIFVHIYAHSRLLVRLIR